jgi:hypothetical protein
LPVYVDGLAECFEDALGDGSRVCGVNDPREHEAEFVAANSCDFYVSIVPVEWSDTVTVPHLPIYALCDHLQNLIASRMAETVVDEFEPIDVDDDDCNEISTRPGVLHGFR